jgi:hypothetical protein
MLFTSAALTNEARGFRFITFGTLRRKLILHYGV